MVFVFFTSIDSHTWIIDSGASDHITPDLSLLHDVKVFFGCCYITMPNGKKAYMKHIGSLVLSPGLVLKGVLHVPDFHFNLLSISKPTKQFSANTVFTPDTCLLQGHTLKKDLLLGKEKRGLYCLNRHTEPQTSLAWDST